jgi:hypothetical protein
MSLNAPEGYKKPPLGGFFVMGQPSPRGTLVAVAIRCGGQDMDAGLALADAG